MQANTNRWQPTVFHPKGGKPDRHRSRETFSGRSCDNLVRITPIHGESQAELILWHYFLGHFTFKKLRLLVTLGVLS